MNNRQEVIAKAIENLEQAVLSMPQDSSNDVTSQSQKSDSHSGESSEPRQEMVAAQAATGPDATVANQVVVGSVKPKKNSLLYRFSLKKHNKSNEIRKPYLAEA